MIWAYLLLLSMAATQNLNRAKKTFDIDDYTFNILDKNKDGKISSDEHHELNQNFMHYRSLYTNKTIDKAKIEFEYLDLNKDGIITRDEYKSRFLSNFTDIKLEKEKLLVYEQQFGYSKRYSNHLYEKMQAYVCRNKTGNQMKEFIGWTEVVTCFNSTTGSEDCEIFKCYDIQKHRDEVRALENKYLSATIGVGVSTFFYSIMLLFCGILFFLSLNNLILGDAVNIIWIWVPYASFVGLIMLIIGEIILVNRLVKDASMLFLIK